MQNNGLAKAYFVLYFISPPDKSGGNSRGDSGENLGGDSRGNSRGNSARNSGENLERRRI